MNLLNIKKNHYNFPRMDVGDIGDMEMNGIGKRNLSADQKKHLWLYGKRKPCKWKYSDPIFYLFKNY